MCGEDGTDDEWGPPVSSDRGADPLEPGDVFDLLADDRDRFVLYVLIERGGTIATDELARTTAAWTDDQRPDRVGRQRAQRVAQRLHHVCLPRLADYGLVTTLENCRAVTLTPAGEQLEPYLEFARGQEDRDVDCYVQAVG